MTGATNFIVRARAVIAGIDKFGQPEIVENGAILVRDGFVDAIGEAKDILAAHPDFPVQGSERHVAIPGLINAHHHSGVTPLQLGVPFAPLELWLPRFTGMRSVDPRLDTLYSAVEMLESGTTTVQHIQGGLAGPPEDWGPIANTIIAAYGEIGMRVSYSFMFRDRNQLVFDDDQHFLATLPGELVDHYAPMLAASRIPVAEAIRFFAALKSDWEMRDADRVRIQLAPANLHWCSDSCLDELFSAARSYGVKLHMHLVETRLQAENARATTGRSAVAHLAALGCLGKELTLGHGIWCDGADLDLIAENGVCLCHNASSGLRLASGIAPINPARQRGIRVALGIDQSGINDDRDMLQEMRVAWAIHREPGLFQDRPAAAEIFKMATEHGAATTGFDRRIGRLDQGSAADIVLLDWDAIAAPYLDHQTPLIDAILHRTKSSAVDKVFVAGEMVVSKGAVCLINKQDLFATIAASLSAPYSATEAMARQMSERLAQKIEAYYRNRGETATASRYEFNAFAQ